MRVVYIHHANRQKGNPSTQDDGISEVGLKDLEVTKQLLNMANQKHKISTIYTSQFFRCTKTAEVINGDIRAKVIVDTRLDEMGSVERETWVDTQIRLHEFLDEIIEKHDDSDTIVCVTSGINLGAFVQKSLNLKASSDFPMYGVPSCSPIVFEFKKGDRWKTL